MFRLAKPIALVVGVFVLFSLGCTPAGPPTFEVKGKVTLDGKPIVIRTIKGQKIGSLRVWVVKQDGADPLVSRAAAVSEDGSFVFEGDTKPLAGKHKVCIEWKDDVVGPDKLGKKFDEKNSPIFRSFPEDKELLLDVGRPGG